MKVKIFAAALAMLTLAAWCPLPVPVVVPPAAHGSSAGGSAAAGAGAVAAGLGILTAVIIAHEAAGPACASRTKYNVAHGYDQPRLWRPLCKKRHHHKRRDPVTPLWPYGK